MSGSSDVLTPILLRSSTPAPSEKVLLYLEGIQRSGGASPVRDSMFTDSVQSEHGFDPDDPRLKRLNSLPRAPSQHRSSGLSRHAYNADGDLQDLGNSELSYGMIDAAEIASDVQEGLRSDIGKSERSASVHGGQGDYGRQEDEPGPKYVSGSSFGNLGPPRESFFGPAPTHPPTQPAWFATGTPSRAANVALPAESEMMSPRSPPKAPWSQAMLRQTGRASAMSPQGRAAVMSPGTADVNIGIEPPTDPSRQSSKEPSRAPSRHSRRSSGGRHDVTSPTPSQAQAQQQQLPGITVNINPDGSTTISIPRNSPAVEKAPTERVPTERAPTEKAYSEAPDEMRSPKARSQRPPGSVVGSRRPSGGEADPLFSPGAQSRSMKSPKAASRAPSYAPPQTVSQMSPIGVFKPLNGFQSFGYPPPEENSVGAPAQSHKAPSQWAQSTRAPSQRPAQSHKEPSEVGTIPNEFTGGTGFDQAPHDETRGSSAYDDYDQGGYPHDQMNGYASNVLRNNATTVSGTTRSGSAQRSPLPMPLPPHMHKGLASSMDSRNSRPKIPVLSPVPSAPNTLRTNGGDPLATPTQSRAPTPEEDDLNDYETEIVQGILSARTPRTSIAPSLLAEEIKRSNYHDEDLCILLHAADDPTQHEIVRKALRKAVAARIRKLGLKSDKESIRQYQKKFHNHDPSWHATNGPSFNPDDPPAWAREMMEQLQSMESRVAALGPQLAKLKKSDGSRTRSQSHTQRSRNPTGMTETVDEWERTPRTQPRNNGMTETVDEWERTPRTQTRNNGLTETVDEWDRTPRTQTIPIGTQMTGADESMYRNADTEYTVPGESIPPTTLQGSMHRLAESQVGPAATEGDEFEDEETRTEGRNGHRRAYTDRTGPTETDFLSYRKREDLLSASGRGESPGQQVLEEELYRLRIKEQARSTAMTHQSWELHEESVNERPDSRVPESEIPDIEEELPRADSPPLPPIPVESQTAVIADSATNERQWQPEYHEAPPTPPWQRIHQRLLNWAIVWPMSELDNAMTSTQRGAQADEVALSIWSTQMYKRYVRQQLTEVPPGRVDRLFVPPNMADAINNAVFHGRHGDACGMLRDLWMPFGLEGMPRIIVVLCKHRSDPSHWVAHKFSLPDGTLTTYDTYPEKCLPDGRPLGWWFAIRIAWPGAMYPSPDHLMQKMVRLHRPTQLSIDNSVAAAGIWRNLLMGSRAERPVDLERLRDLINTEVKNLRQRKEQGKLSVAAAIRQNWNWEDTAS